MRKNIVAGNWKMNKTLQEGIALAKEIKASLSGKTPKCEVIVGTPFIHLASVCEELKDSVIAVAAENCVYCRSRRTKSRLRKATFVSNRLFMKSNQIGRAHV